MFKNLISKSVIRDNMLILIPPKVKDNSILILISHGSGGVGNAEYFCAETFLKKGYKVAIQDYFSKHNIKNLWWNYEEKFIDDHNITFAEMLDCEIDSKIIHIGFSLGGFRGILNAEKFYKNYCFYPGILGITNDMMGKDYSNTTVFTASKDEWCDYEHFENAVDVAPNRMEVDAYHGFMIPGKDKEITIAKYHFPKDVITDEEFKKLKPNHEELSKYGFDKKKIRLQFNKEYANICYSYIGRHI